MSLCARDKESQKHPGRPDLPHPKQSTHEVQALRVEKAHVQTEKEQLCLKTIQSTARLVAEMEARQKEKFAMAHHPPPPRITQRKAPRVPVKVPPVAMLGMCIF